ncbi:uncharacterized protein LODBEIA_P42470 [Lodderomyces beijingensis]|uniref:Uncharacterized protein n=1 Tax=Lodderomyces beijingensis TaxID=1775926 RepID=A0ABP0ZQR9_9ASCO
MNHTYVSLYLVNAAMDNVYTALSISLIAKRRLVVSCEDSCKAIPHFTAAVLKNCGLEPEEYTVVDLLQHQTLEAIVDKSTSVAKDGKRYFKQMIVWQNLQRSSQELQKQLYQMILQIDHYEMNKAKYMDNPPASVHMGKSVVQIYKPEIFAIVPFLEYRLFDEAKLYIFLKEKFWQSVNFPNFDDASIPVSVSAGSTLGPDRYKPTILELRAKMASVFISPDIKGYIYSLIVFIRCHRMASLAPKQVRVPTMTMDYVKDFCRAWILWKTHLLQKPTETELASAVDRSKTSAPAKKATLTEFTTKTEQEEDLFVTPEYVKLAVHKICYWLVDWQYNKKFAATDDPDLDAKGKSEKEIKEEEKSIANKKLEISMLTGDWYGSEYLFVNEYLKTQKMEKDYSSPTGFTNKIVDDCIRSVRPPL